IRRWLKGLVGHPPEQVAPSHRHINQDGTTGSWVANTAHVAETATVKESAQVSGRARVLGFAQIRDNAHISGSAPYVWGGGATTGPSGSATEQPPALEGKPGFDCSGLMLYAFAKAGVSLPRTSEEQQALVQAGGHYSTNLSSLVAGDLLFFDGSDGTATSAGHFGLYLGGGNMIDAPSTGAVVRVEPITGFGGFLGGRKPLLVEFVGHGYLHQ